MPRKELTLTDFGRWIEKQPGGVLAFCTATGLKFWTVNAWRTRPGTPRDAHKDIIRTHFPECPILHGSGTGE